MRSVVSRLMLVMLSLCFCAAISPPISVYADEAFSTAAIGKAAPDFELADSNGKTHKLSDFNGKFVVLEWFNDGCPFVKKHYESGNMQKLQREFTRRGVVWLTINSSAPGKQGNHSPSEFNDLLKEKKAVPTALLIDTEGKVGHLYGAKTTPDMFIVNKEGILIYSGAIDDQPDTNQDSIPKAQNYVRAALDEALAGKQVKIATTKSYGCSVKYQ